MREVSFIKQNKERWLEFEDYLYYNVPIDPDHLSELFIQLNNDLAYTKTYFPKSNLNTYLNALSVRAYLKIVKPQTTYDTVSQFWRMEIPLLAYKYRQYIYFALSIFFLFFTMSILSSLSGDNFVRQILGDAYVNESVQNIRNGDPAAVYNNDSFLGNAGSFLGITINNFRVGLLMYITGVFLGFGTIKLLFSNAVMVGAFIIMFQQYGGFAQSMSAIWIHGSMEIFSMIIQSAAGLLLGLGWLYPGTFTRRQAFLIKGKHSLKIYLSTIPFTVSAGFLEGFVTQYYNEMQLVVSFSIVIITLGFIMYYYLIYPIKVFKKTGNSLMSTYHDYVEAAK